VSRRYLLTRQGLPFLPGTVIGHEQGHWQARLMPVSKRLRFEILRRDNNTCRYCGRSAPDVVLTVDHVVPTVLGGRDEPSNLVTACMDCNAGKTSSAPDQQTIDSVSDDALRWAAAMRRAG
jgi:5-methylcytosine-specific restriction endonuclease McrA